MKSRFMKRMLSFILATVLLMGNVMPVMAEGSVSGNEVAETVVEETVVEESAVSEEPVSESEVIIEEESSEVSTTETTEETSSVESTTEESTEEETTEVSTEESTEEETEESTEDSVSENEIPEDELSVSANEIIDEEVPLAGALPVSLEPVTVNGITITVSGPASAFAEGTTVSAVEVEPAEVVIEAAEESEQAEVKRYKAFDINLVCNGEVVQPLNGEEITVNFEGDLLIPNTDEEEDVVVYHVDDNDEITKMEAEVATVETEDAAEVETVEMTTTHFSTYVVVITGAESEYEVIYRHYADVNGDGTKEQFYKPTTEIVKNNSIKTYTDFEEAGKTVGGGEYEISSIKVDFEDDKKQDVTISLSSNWPREIKVEIEDNATIELYYEPAETTGNNYENDVVFYDYSVGTAKESTIYVSKGDRINIWGTEDFYVSAIERGRIVLTHVSGNWTKELRLGEHAYDTLIYNGKTYAQYKYDGQSNSYGNGIRGRIKVYTVGGINDVEIEIENGTITSADNLKGRYLAMGKTDIRNAYGSVRISGSNGGNANGFEGGRGTKAIVQGIVSGLSDDLKTVNWGTNSDGQKIVEPGYFTTNEIDGAKAVYDTEFKLKFEQSGHNYQLYSAYSDVYGTETLTRVTADEETYDYHTYKKGDISGQFFPLEKVSSAEHSEVYFEKTYNWYFGMRYDFSFELGDYIGPLEYSFEGDDDLWVLVDGELVLDLGGVHSAYPSRYSDATLPNEVDIWEKYFGVSQAERDANPDDWWEKIDQLGNGKYDPEKTYTVTVLYMERGGYASTCFMDFTLPNVESRHVDHNYGSLSFVKIADDTKVPLANAEFTLFDEAGNAVKTDVSNANGVVKFDGLVAGDYTLKETRSPEGYLLSEEVWTVTVTERTWNDSITVDVVLKDSDGNVITEIVNVPEIKDINLEFVKVDSQNTAIVLSDAEFTLTSQDGEVTKTATSDENGKIVFENISEGTYTLSETKAPEGYLPSEETLTVKVEMINGELGYTVSGDEDNLWLFYEKIDEKHLLKNTKPVDIEIIKEWKNYKGEELSDDKINTESITVKLFRKVGRDGLKEEVIVPSAPIVLRKSDNQEENWRKVIKDLPSACEAGQWIYSVEEVTEVEGFESKCDVDPITNGNVITLTIINTELVGNLKITKTVFREDGENPVDAVHGDATFIFKITCLNDIDKEDDDTVLYRTISFTESETVSVAGRTKSVTVENLPVGSYTVEELSALRYTCTSQNPQDRDVVKNATAEINFSNEKTYDGNYSHTDVVVNKVTFERDADGNIIKAKYDQVKTSATEPVTEYKKGE